MFIQNSGEGKEPGEPERGIGSDRVGLGDDALDGARHVDGLGYGTGAHVQRHKIEFTEHFARMNGRKDAGSHGTTFADCGRIARKRLVVIGDFDLLRARIRPSKTDAELVIDPILVPTGAFALEGLEPVPRRRAKIFQRGGGFYSVQKQLCPATVDRPETLS